MKAAAKCKKESRAGTVRVTRCVAMWALVTDPGTACCAMESQMHCMGHQEGVECGGWLLWRLFGK